MGSHPVNLIFRFLLEIAALVAAGMWSWKQGEGWFRYILVLAVPITLAALWGTFAVVDDPSRSGKAPVVIPGLVRLILEFAFFGFAVWALYNLNYTKMSIILGMAILLHYALSYDRILWLLSK